MTAPDHTPAAPADPQQRAARRGMSTDDYRDAFAALAASVGLRRYGTYDSWGLPGGGRLELRLSGRTVGRGYCTVARWCVLGDIEPAACATLATLATLAQSLPDTFGHWQPAGAATITAREPHGWGSGAFDDTKGT